MKLQNILGLFAIGFFLNGCSTPAHYDPSLKAAASTELVKVVSIEATPAKPVAPHPWRVAMKVKNVGHQPLENLTYTFLIGGKGEKLGEGKIARLAAGETLSVTSEEARVEQGNYRVEGRVFLQNAAQESNYNDRMDNWKATTVVVAQ